MKELYQKRKETIERLFGTAKEYHNLRYTREIGKSKKEDKVELTLVCLNLKKLVKLMAGRPFYFGLNGLLSRFFTAIIGFGSNYKKRQTPKMKFVFNLSGLLSAKSLTVK